MGGIQSTFSSLAFNFNKTPTVVDDQDWELLDDKVYYLPEGQQEAPKMYEKSDIPKPNPIRICSGKDRNARILERAEIMIHVQECTNKCCLRPHCKVMKPVMLHNEDCKLGNDCTVLHCPSATQIKRHWEKCSLWDCPICWITKKDAPIVKEMLDGLDVASWTNIDLTEK